MGHDGRFMVGRHLEWKDNEGGGWQQLLVVLQVEEVVQVVPVVMGHGVIVKQRQIPSRYMILSYGLTKMETIGLGAFHRPSN